MKKNTPFCESTLKNKEEGVAKLSEHIDKLNPWQLLATEYLAGVFKSVSLSLLALGDQISLEQAIEYSRIEEKIQEEYYGRVEGAHDLDDAHIAVNVYSCKLLFDLCADYRKN